MKLDDLPQDVLALVVGLIERRPDLRNFCLASKTLYSAGLAKLYYRFAVPELISVRSLATTLSLENAGLQYVRHVRIIPRSRRYDEYDEVVKQSDEQIEAHQDVVVAMLANLLPRDSMLSLTLDINRRLDLGLPEILPKKQRNLRTCRLDSDTVLQPKDLACITSLQLEITKENSDFLWQAHHNGARLKACSSLISLELRLGLYAHDPYMEGLHEDYEGFKRDSDYIMSELFTKWRAPPMKLQTLRLWGVHLKNSHSRVLEAMDLAHLRHLEIRECEHTTNFLVALGPRSEQDRCAVGGLQTLVVTTPAEGFYHKVWNISDLLEHCNHLETFILSAPRDTTLTPVEGSLAPSSQTLRALYLDCCYEDAGGLDEMLESVETFKALEQIAIVSPELYLNPRKSARVAGFKEYCGILARAPELRTASFLTIPNDAYVEPPFEKNRICEAYIRDRLKEMAEVVLDRVPNLTAVAVCNGDNWALKHTGVLVEPRYYIRGKTLDPRGTENVSAIEVELGALRSFERHSQLMQFDPLTPYFFRYEQGL